MKFRRFPWRVLMFGLPAAFVGYAFFHGFSSRDRDIYMRQTLVVETPEGERTGSSVILISVGFQDGLLKGLGNAIVVGIGGEAVVVDLGERGILFSLLVADPSRKNSRAPDDLLSFLTELKKGWTPASLDAAKLHVGKLLLPANSLPMLVRFRDLDDPTSVERVEPDDLASAFGTGVRLVTASIEITEAPTTDKILGILKWLPKFYDKLLDGRHIMTIEASNGLSNKLASGSFKSNFNN